MGTSKKIRLTPEAQPEQRTQAFARQVRALYDTEVRLQAARTRVADLELERRRQQHEVAQAYGSALDDSGPILVEVPCPDGSPVCLSVEVAGEWWDDKNPVVVRPLASVAEALAESEGEA
jgi:hypothetical protein